LVAANHPSSVDNFFEIQILEVRAFDAWVGTIDPLAWDNWFLWLNTGGRVGTQSHATFSQFEWNCGVLLSR
jgi:hypothetical protein